VIRVKQHRQVGYEVRPIPDEADLREGFVAFGAGGSFFRSVVEPATVTVIVPIGRSREDRT